MFDIERLLSKPIVQVRTIVFALLACLVLPVSGALAQTIAVVEIEGEVDLGKPGQVTAKVKRLASDEASGSLDKFVHGQVTVKPADDGSAQVVVSWTALSSDSSGSDAVSLAPPLETKQVADQVKLPSGASMSVSGDVNALIRGSRTIEENAQVPEEGEGEEAAEAGTGGSSGSSEQSAGLGSSIDRTEAELPQMQAVTETEQVETIVQADVYGTTTDGCEPELATDGTKVLIFEKPIKNGISDGECAAGIETSPVESTYVGCGYDVRLGVTPPIAVATHRRFYTWGANTTSLDTECSPDETKTYIINKTEDGCKVVPDMATLKAVQFEQLTYEGRQNDKQSIPGEGCQARGGKEFPIKVALCGLHDDFDAKKTFEMESASYVGDDKLRRNIGDCTTTTRYYVHKEDTSVCNVLPDLDAGKLYEQYRIKINIAVGLGYNPFRTNTCKPFTQALTDIQETAAGCESVHFDYAGYSRGAKRLIRKDTGANVRDCLEADINYPHQYQAEGWLAEDAKLIGTPKEVSYINLPSPAGKTIISAAIVRPGAVAKAYTLAGLSFENGVTEFVGSGCDKYTKQNKMEHWLRPDGTTFKRQNGFGASLGPTFGCNSTVSQFRLTRSSFVINRVGNYSCYEENGSQRPITIVSTGSYVADRTLTRSDGVFVSKTPGGISYTCGTKPPSCHGSHPVACPATLSPTGSLTSQLGW